MLIEKLLSERHLSTRDLEGLTCFEENEGPSLGLCLAQIQVGNHCRARRRSDSE